MFIAPIKAKKSLGQNFLIDEDALSDIAESIEVSGKHIIEVGPGYGALTDYLVVKNPESLDLVELDRDMIELLVKKCTGAWELWNCGLTKNGETEGDKLSLERNDSKESDEPFGEERPFRSEAENGSTLGVLLSPSAPFATFQGGKVEHLCIYKADILQFQPKYREYSVIANIPYYITSPILFHFLYDLPAAPEEMVIMMQKEVGEKILAGRARKPHHSLLSLAMEQACEDIEAVRYVGAESFHPAPKVDSIVLRFIVKRERNREEENTLIKLWECAFTHPRKTLISNLKGSPYNAEHVRKILIELGYDDRVRAEAIRREDWKTLLGL